MMLQTSLTLSLLPLLSFPCFIVQAAGKWHYGMAATTAAQTLADGFNLDT